MLVDATHAIMSPEELEELPEYSLSIPTEGGNVGDGFRWRCQRGAFRWLLAEYVPRYVSKSGILWRHVILEPKPSRQFYEQL